MALTNDIISQFVKATKDNETAKPKTTFYGTTVKQDDKTYVRLDGSEILTPVIATADTHDGERVTVTIENHTAIITGNISSPAARVDDVEDVSDLRDRISEFEIVIAGKVSTEDLEAESARIDTLVTDNTLIKKQLSAAEGDIDNLQTSTLNVTDRMTAAEADITTLSTEKLDVSVADITYATIEGLEATDVSIHDLEATYAEFAKTTTQDLEAAKATISNLDVTYAKIDFTNIGQAAMEYFYATSGLIENVVVSEGSITGMLVGVTIKGDLFEANTIVADKLVILGEDGLYYKLNTNGVTTGAEQTEYNSLNGSIITAKSVTAEKVNVDDLVAFDATIGGFNITEDAIFSDIKDDEGNSIRGIYMDKEGQFNFGDADNFVKYYKDDEGNYHLAISAETILYDINGTQKSIADLGIIGEYVKISTYEGEPCIELGESDSDFKLIITNTRIMFMEGTGVPAYISNQSLFIKKAVIEEELQQGGFIWKARSNGNLGLIWKGVSS